MSRQSESELRAFQSFIDVSRLTVVANSVEARQPPEPDVRCQLKNGEIVAFELVEISNPANARFAASAHKVHGAIMTAYTNLPPSTRCAFEARFRNVPLSFSFRGEASRAAIERELPRLLTELVSMTESEAGYSPLSRPVAEVVHAVNARGRLNDPVSVNFSLGGSFDPAVLLEAISAKLDKRYETAHPIELLAHFGAWASGDSTGYRKPILDLINDKGLGPFRRLWVHDWSGIGLVVPDDPRVSG